MEALVDEYLADCAQAGREPTKPFKGTFNVRIPAELHRSAAMDAAQEGQSLNAWITKAVEEKLDRDRLAGRFDDETRGRPLPLIASTAR